LEISAKGLDERSRKFREIRVCGFLPKATTPFLQRSPLRF
jgi:hypothetical protein